MSTPLFRPLKRLRTKSSPSVLFGVQEATPGTLDLSDESVGGKKAVYLVTAAHPVQSHSACGVLLKSPDTYSKQWLHNAVIDVFANPVYTDQGNQARCVGRQLKLVRFVIVKEFHEADANGQQHAHYHIALQAEESFRFLPFKRSFLQRWGVATHWSCSHLGYWSALRYLVWPSPPKKLATNLDRSPLPWHRDGEGMHETLAEASQQPTNAAMLEARREKLLMAAGDAGDEEPRPREIDVWPIVVKHGVRNDHDRQDGYLQLIKVARTSCSPAMVAYLFQIRHKLNKLIEDVWTWETVDDLLHLSGRSRMTALEDALRQPCCCDGQWATQVRRVLVANGISEAELAHDIYISFAAGRCETTPVVTLAGLQGGEGKSLIFFPIPKVLGGDFVQGHTASGSFPLLGLEGKKAVVLDEWRFAASALPIGIQLLWFEGKPVPLTRPQGESIGHLLYKGTAPIFITTPMKRLEKLETEAKAARAAGISCEATMLLRRLKVHRFNVAVSKPQKQIPACANCFANFLFEGEMLWCQMCG